MSKPPVIIIAGGANSRFFPFQNLGHKGAFTLHGEPLLVRTLRSLQKHGFTEVAIVLTPGDIESQFTENLVTAAGLDIHVQYVLQPEPKGMGDAVLRGVDALPKDVDTLALDPVGQRTAIITAYQINAGEILSAMLDHGQETIIATAKTDQPWEFGIVEFNESGRAIGITEKPKKGSEASDQRILTLYVLSESTIETLRKAPAGEYNFEDALATEFRKHPALVFPLMIQLPSLKYPWHILDFQEHLFVELGSYRATTAEVSPTAVIDETLGPVYIGENAVIGHCSRIVGPCYVSNDVIIGDFSLVRQSSLEANVAIGCFSEVTRSVISARTHMHSGYVGDSVIGPDVRIGAAIITANKRLDRGSIGIKVKNTVADSGRTRLGVFIGSNAHIGVRVSTMPGKTIAPGEVIKPHTVVDGK